MNAVLRLLSLYLLHLTGVKCFHLHSKCKLVRSFQQLDSTSAKLPDPITADETVPEFIQKINEASVEIVKGILVAYYGDRHYARFAALETIARVPYFSYTSVLHLYETLGWFRRKEYIKMHFSESWNELHHLLIMESLGGSDRFGDRFIAQHIAFFYYWIVVLIYMTTPAIAYNLNMYVERHAFDTYNKFLKSHGDLLKLQPPPQIAVEYYEKGDLSLFDSFHHANVFTLLSSTTTSSKKTISTSMNPSTYSTITNTVASKSFESLTPTAENNIYDDHTTLLGNSSLGKRRPKINTLYDVFYHICIDEAEHANTMELLSKDITQLQFISDRTLDTTTTTTTSNVSQKNEDKSGTGDI